MLLNIVKHNGSTELKYIEVGQKVVGLRWYSVVLESSEEAAKLFTDEGKNWWLRNILPGFKKLAP